MDLNIIEQAAHDSKDRNEEFVSIEYGEDDNDEYDSDMESQPQYIHMELRSTSVFKDIDIDQMLEAASFEDFMQGLYLNRI